MKRVIGIELGSTRIKAVMLDENGTPLASGSYGWENKLSDGIWTYSLDEAVSGVRESCTALLDEYEQKYSGEIKIDAIGISAMMHGYIARDKNGKLLTPFRTWRNTNTQKASDELSEVLDFNIPLRWSVAQYYQDVLDGKDYLPEIVSLDTLSSYIHSGLTGERVIGIGDASGMFPVSDGGYDRKRISAVNELLSKHGISKDFSTLLPEIRIAGEYAGKLTDNGAMLLDNKGRLYAGIPLCAPEGDAGTGMIATNCISPKSASVSAGTSAFLLAVLEKPLAERNSAIDIVTTPAGSPVALVQVNNFSNELNAWISLFGEVCESCGMKVDAEKMFPTMFKKSLEADFDVGNIIAYNYLSGEHITHTEVGRPLLVRLPDGKFSLANFMKAQIFSALGTLAMGVKMLTAQNVKLERVCAHGGFFKTEFVGQSAMSAALDAPVTVLQSAGEGGAYGIALLALFLVSGEKDCEAFLNSVFENAPSSTVCADDAEKQRFAHFLSLYEKGLGIEISATGLI